MAPKSYTGKTRGSNALWREELASLKHFGLLRQLRQMRGAPGRSVSIDGRDALLLCSNNYLGLAGDDRLKQAAHEALELYGCGATGSRLISGNLDLCGQLEQELAVFKGTEAALVFTSGYQANLGAITGMTRARDAIISDELNHASILDACKISAAQTYTYHHCDLEELEKQLVAASGARRKLIVTESVFSMDGDIAPLKGIADLSERYGAMLMVDEAHATGVFGTRGAGLVEEMELSGKVTVQMGTFSKALGSLGGYIAGSRDLIDYLVQRARSFVFTTGLPPAVLAASLAALRIVPAEPERRRSLFRNARHLQEQLVSMGFEMGIQKSQILPLRLQDARLTMAACKLLLRNGVFVQGIRFPTVPRGTARLRITPTSQHTDGDISSALTAFGKLQNTLSKRSARRAKAAPVAAP